MAMNFGQALEWIKKGGQVARDGWNSKGMWLALVGATGWCINDSVPAFDAIVRKTMANTMPWIGMKTSDGAFVPWAASQTDLLAEDWCAVQSVVEICCARCSEFGVKFPATANYVIEWNKLRARGWVQAELPRDHRDLICPRCQKEQR